MTIITIDLENWMSLRPVNVINRWWMTVRRITVEAGSSCGSVYLMFKGFKDSFLLGLVLINFLSALFVSAWWFIYFFPFVCLCAPQVLSAVERLWLSHPLPGFIPLQRRSLPAGAAARTDGGLRRHHRSACFWKCVSLLQCLLEAWAVFSLCYSVSLCVVFTVVSWLVGFVFIRFWGDAGGLSEHRSVLWGRKEAPAGWQVLSKVWTVQQSKSDEVTHQSCLVLWLLLFRRLFSFWTTVRRWSTSCCALTLKTTWRSRWRLRRWELWAKECVCVRHFFYWCVCIPGWPGQGQLFDQSADRLPDGGKWRHAQGNWITRAFSFRLNSASIFWLLNYCSAVFLHPFLPVNIFFVAPSVSSCSREFSVFWCNIKKDPEDLDFLHKCCVSRGNGTADLWLESSREFVWQIVCSKHYFEGLKKKIFNTAEAFLF